MSHDPSPDPTPDTDPATPELAQLAYTVALAAAGRALPPSLTTFLGAGRTG